MPRRVRRPRLHAALAATCVAATLVGCTGDDAPSDSGAAPSGAAGSTAASVTTTTAAPGVPILFSPEGNNLWVYETTPPFAAQRLVANRSDSPDGWDVNGQVCFLGGGRFVAGEDTGQPDPPAGWAVFQLAGSDVGALTATRVEKLVPPFQPTDEHPDTIGCGVLSGDRIVTTTIGNSASGTEDGSLILWLQGDDGGRMPCLLDTGLGTAQTLIVVDEMIYVASARGSTAGINRYRGPFPETLDECSVTDPGSGTARAPRVARETFIRLEATPLLSPSGVVRDPATEHWYVSSVANGVIAELDENGGFVRTVLRPPEGESLEGGPYSTGTPLGLAIDAAGTLYYADLGLALDDGRFGPVAGAGSVRRVEFVDGEPQPPETIADGLSFPDGLGLMEPALLVEGADR